MLLFRSFLEAVSQINGQANTPLSITRQNLAPEKRIYGEARQKDEEEEESPETAKAPRTTVEESKYRNRPFFTLAAVRSIMGTPCCH